MEKILPARCCSSGKAEAERMIEFARLHVKAALEAAAKNAYYTGGGTWKTNEGHLESNPIRVDKDSILNAYPESLIV